MDNVKVNVSIVISGSTLPAEKERKGKLGLDPNLEYEQLNLKFERENIVINLRKAVPAIQSLHMNQDAYKFAVSPDNPIRGIKSGDWKRMSNTKRLEAHLSETASFLGGTLLNYVILDD